ncbi:amidohydrolase family protein [Mailhella sp.]
MIIDCRVRPAYKSYLKTKVPFNIDGAGALAAHLNLELPPCLLSGKPDYEAMIVEMDASGITHAVLWGRKSPNWGDVPNTEIAEVVEMGKGRFVGVGAVDVRPTTKLKAQIQECIDLGLAGVAVEPGQLNPPEKCSGAILYPLYAACQDNGLILHLTSNIYSAPNALWSDPAHIDQVAADFPELKIVVGHASHPHAAELCGIAYYRKNVYLCPGVYLPHAVCNDAYIDAANKYLGDQIIFGSTYPVASFASVVKGYEEAGFAPGVYEKVMYGNAMKLYGFEA